MSMIILPATVRCLKTTMPDYLKSTGDIINTDILPEITEPNVNYSKEGEIKCLNTD